jgi:hypothetical protein
MLGNECARMFWAAVVLACDVLGCEALLRGLAVPRYRLHGGVLTAIDEDPFDGPAIVLSDELALRIELAMFPGWWAAGRPSRAATRRRSP